MFPWNVEPDPNLVPLEWYHASGQCDWENMTFHQPLSLCYNSSNFFCKANESLSFFIKPTSNDERLLVLARIMNGADMEEIFEVGKEKGNVYCLYLLLLFACAFSVVALVYGACFKMCAKNQRTSQSPLKFGIVITSLILVMAILTNNFVNDWREAATTINHNLRLNPSYNEKYLFWNLKANDRCKLQNNLINPLEFYKPYFTNYSKNVLELLQDESRIMEKTNNSIEAAKYLKAEVINLIKDLAEFNAIHTRDRANDYDQSADDEAAENLLRAMNELKPFEDVFENITEAIESVRSEWRDILRDFEERKVKAQLEVEKLQEMKAASFLRVSQNIEKSIEFIHQAFPDLPKKLTSVYGKMKNYTKSIEQIPQLTAILSITLFIILIGVVLIGGSLLYGLFFVLVAEHPDYKYEDDSTHHKYMHAILTVSFFLCCFLILGIAVCSGIALHYSVPLAFNCNVLGASEGEMKNTLFDEGSLFIFTSFDGKERIFIRDFQAESGLFGKTGLSILYDNSLANLSSIDQNFYDVDLTLRNSIVPNLSSSTIEYKGREEVQNFLISLRNLIKIRDAYSEAVENFGSPTDYAEEVSERNIVSEEIQNLTDRVFSLKKKLKNEDFHVLNRANLIRIVPRQPWQYFMTVDSGVGTKVFEAEEAITSFRREFDEPYKQVFDYLHKRSYISPRTKICEEWVPYGAAIWFSGTISVFVLMACAVILFKISNMFAGNPDEPMDTSVEKKFYAHLVPDMDLSEKDVKIKI